jgi:DNA-binding NarL/FixJ family response regulator
MKPIAFDLGISLPSVKTFAQRAYRKLGVGSAQDAVGVTDGSDRTAVGAPNERVALYR